MPHPRFRPALTLTGVAALTGVAVVAGLYHLGRCPATCPHDPRGHCVHAVDHLHDHGDQYGHRWDDDLLRQRRSIAGIMYSAGARPAPPPIIRGPKDLLRRLAYTAHPAEQ